MVWICQIQAGIACRMKKDGTFASIEEVHTTDFDFSRKEEVHNVA